MAERTISADPTDWGRRLLPSLVDSIAKTTPSRTYATIPVTIDLAKGFQDVSFIQMANAINNMANFLEIRFGRSDIFETLCFLGPPDLRTPVLFYAAIKCGFKV